jgi:hypothetical protein
LDVTLKLREQAF